MLLCVTLSACGQAERPKTVSDASVTCAAFRVISFAQLPKSQIDDPGNKADSNETVSEVLAHNARFLALCPRPDP
jgi:hypothetical protein